MCCGMLYLRKVLVFGKGLYYVRCVKFDSFVVIIVVEKRGVV